MKSARLSEARDRDPSFQKKVQNCVPGYSPVIGSNKLPVCDCNMDERNRLRFPAPSPPPKHSGFLRKKCIIANVSTSVESQDHKILAAILHIVPTENNSLVGKRTLGATLRCSLRMCTFGVASLLCWSLISVVLLACVFSDEYYFVRDSGAEQACQRAGSKLYQDSWLSTPHRSSRRPFSTVTENTSSRRCSP